MGKRTGSFVERARTAVSLCALLAIGGLAVGCGQQADTGSTDKPTLNVWYTTFREDTVKQFVEQKQVQNATLVSRRFDPSDLSTFERLAIDNIAADNAPDVWILPNDWVPDNVNKFITIPDDFWNDSSQGGLATTTENIQKKYIPAIGTDLIGEDGRLAGFPGPAQTLVLYKNRDLFSQAYNEWSLANQDASQEEQYTVQRILTQEVTTWDDLVAVSKLITIKDANGYITRSGVALGNASNISYANDILQLMIYQQGGSVVDSIKRISLFNNYEKKTDGQTYYPGRDAFAFYTSFADPTSQNYSWNASLEGSRQAFLDGKVAMIIDYPDFADTILQNKASIAYEVKNVPQLYSDHDQVNFARYFVAAVTKASQNQRLAATLAKSIVVDDGPGLVSGWSSSSLPTIQSETQSDINAKQLQTAKTVYKRHHNEFDQAFAEMIDDVSVRRLTIDNAINRGAERITKILQSE